MRALWIVVVLVTAVPYLSTVDNPLIWDSQATVVDDPSIRSLGEVPGYFVAGTLPATDGPQRVAYWRPVPKALLAAQYAAFGPSPAAFHAVSVLLGALGVWAAGRAVHALTGDERVALGAALLWGLSPARGEAIAWVYGQSTLLCALFVLAGVTAHHRGRAALSLAAFAAALLCRESAVMLPAAVALVEWGFAAQPSWRRVAPTGALVLAWLAVRTVILGAPPVTALSPVEWLSTAPLVATAALEAAVWPRGAIALHPLVTLATPAAATAVGAVVAAATLGALAWLARPGGPRATAAWLAWPVLWTLPWLNVGRFADFLFTEKAMYLGSLGLAAAAATGLTRHPWAVVGLATVLGARTTWRTAHWADEPTFLAAVVASTPDYAPPVFLLAVSKAQSGDLAGAEPLFIRAAALRPERAAAAWLNAGNCRDGLGDVAGAEAAWRQALEHDPALPGALLNLAVNAERRRELPVALELYRRFLAAEPAPPPGLVQKVAALEQYLAR